MFASRTTALAIALACATLPAAAVPSGYTLVDLGAYQQPQGLNAAGTIAGSTSAFNGPTVAETHANGTWTVLKHRGASSVGSAINRKGDVAGQDGADAVRWHLGKRKVLTAVGGGTAEGISDNGRIVGTYMSGGNQACYSWAKGVITNLGTLGGAVCRAHTIDATGKYIGGESYVKAGTGADHAFIHDATGMHDLGVLPGGAYSWVRSVNTSGHASVWADHDNSGDWAATYWNGRALVEVPGVLGPDGESFAGAINNHDEMVVVGYDAQGHVLFVYSGDTGVVTPIEPLIHNAAGWDFGFAARDVGVAIGDDGTIVGGAAFNGEQHGFMLVPAGQ